MATSTEASEEKVLKCSHFDPATSPQILGHLPQLTRDSCNRSGILYSQITNITINKLIIIIEKSLAKIRDNINTNPSSMTAQLLYNMSEQCTSIIQYNKVTQLVESLLCTALLHVQHYDTPISELLSQMFLQSCTELVVNEQTQHDISYQFKISLWQLHRHSYEEMLCHLLKEGLKCKNEKDFKSLVTKSEVDKACLNNSHLYLYTIEFFKISSLHISGDHETSQSQTIWQGLSDCLQINKKQFK